jgi:hypothetical protein
MQRGVGILIALSGKKNAYEKYDRQTIQLWPAALAVAVDAYSSFKCCWSGLSSAPAQIAPQTADTPGRPQCGNLKRAVAGRIGQYFP